MLLKYAHGRGLAGKGVRERGLVCIIYADTTTGRTRHRYFSKLRELQVQMCQPTEPGVKTRLIVLTYWDLSVVDYEVIGVIGVIGTYFGIDPHFFDRNVGYGFGSIFEDFNQTSGRSD
jgi:hypothetical protein